MAVYVLLVYIILGIAAYLIVKRTGGIFLNKENKVSEWSLVISYTVLVNMISNFLVTLVLQLLNHLSISITTFGILFLISNLLIIWIAVVFQAWSVGRVPPSVVRKSIYFFLIPNLIFLVIFKYLSNQLSLNFLDIVFICNFFVFYLATKRYLKVINM